MTGNPNNSSLPRKAAWAPNRNMAGSMPSPSVLDVLTMLLAGPNTELQGRAGQTRAMACTVPPQSRDRTSDRLTISAPGNSPSQKHPNTTCS